MRLIKYFFLYQIILGLTQVCFAEEIEESGMIMIEIVEDPGFFEQFGSYIYTLIIIATLGYFFWRRYQQGREKS